MVECTKICTRFFFIRNQFIRNLHVESQKFKKLLQLHCYDYFLNKKHIFHVCYDEWHVGTITWYNVKLDECRVLYVDKSEDYLKLDDFNGVDVILLD